MKAHIRRLAFIAVAVSFVLTGCQNSDTSEADSSEADHDMSEETAAMGPDTTGAAVWAHLQEADYQNEWALWPDKGAHYTGQQPHGALLTTYLNESAANALESGAGSMPEGAVIVKENYMPDSSLAAVTVMYKVNGYNPSEGDWFYTKHLPDGSLDQGPNGMALEGRVPGCIGCHRGQSSNDYIFTSSLSQ